MLSISNIDRTLQSRNYDRLLQDLARNGLVMPLPLRIQLAESAAGARGLGLRRLIELTYGPTAQTFELMRKLMAAQSPSGAVLDGAGRASCLLTAAFAAGLGRALRDHVGRLWPDEAEIQLAYGRAIQSLASMQGADALFVGCQDRHPQDAVLTSAFIAYLLMDSPGFAEACHGHALLSALEDSLDDCSADAEQLIGMARLARLTPVAAPDRASEFVNSELYNSVSEAGGRPLSATG